MAAFDLEEQEQISQIKGWWEQYGTVVTAIAVVAALASVGWQGWSWYRGKQGAEASALYGVVQQAAAERNAQKAREAAGTIIEKYSGTPYADLAALMSAKVQSDVGDLKNARVPLAWAAEKANDPALRSLARLRLASVLLDEKAYDEALAQVQAPVDADMAARFADLKGDILVAKGKPEEARAAYKEAVDALAGATKSEASALREIAQAKLDAVGSVK
ncbi:tetratricopeptide repeat protein [Zoogloea sp.]|jgi:predicted negative regulator of RcsB-dependent stress response|uniref:YfgM family protein n=1 Tax=Zoogloea sp. TaxID=49181 RepID=UPI0011D4EE4A|nr:tetratricopeptide repeat protein [Zoogloea sp.]MBK6653126.1 tetratricopeptide repeat protein [Zoogloea sp.]MBP7443281.1 tetratricopeptide repeat protein [Zoogloea sp.]TXG96544.1 MAG: tetratricopeptide repeat protein [Zoogloea sp.]HOY00054.1 tetratricopeptide repeat protein [Zoogloea sp.]HPI58754.1 tetratricopeptide repeat protein [Zoogloea sp.]